MFRIVTNITITQRPTTAYPSHNKILKLDFLESFEVESTWENQTTKGTLTIPKNLYYLDVNNSKNPLNGTKINVGGFGSEPLFMRGDAITISAGYKDLQENTIFTGYISRVYSQIPIKIDVEDNMWLLKQTPLGTKTFTESDNIEDILKFICDKVNAKHKTSITFNALTKTNVGNIIMVENETASQLLRRINTLYKFKSYFRGNELRCGVLNYLPSDVVRHVFIMNGQAGNIPEDGQELEYSRKDDIVLSAAAYNTITEDDGVCKNGTTPKKKKTRLEVLVTYKNGEESSKVIANGERVPENEEGERRTFFFPQAKTSKELIDLATQQLKNYYYDGLKGSFITFGIPFVKHGDYVELRNPIMQEQNGVFVVKSVEYFFNDGLRQKVTLDFKV